MDLKSLVEPAADALGAYGECPAEVLQIVDATKVAEHYYPHFDPAGPALLVGLDDGSVAVRIRQTLLTVYPAEHPVTVISPDGRQEIPLAQLGEAASLRPGACLWIPALLAPSSTAVLQDVIAHLRAPEGCPWDRELTWSKLRASLLEEAYELLAALDAGDPAKVVEEQGDLLLQIAMQAQIAAEEGLFRWPDVITAVVAKLVRRHPHVFGDVTVSGTAEVLANWEEIKRAERASNGQQRSPLAGIPKGLPALAQAHAYLDRMSRIRTDPAPETPWLELAHLPSDAAVSPDLLGQTLFEIVAWARVRGLDAESALRSANARFAAQVEAEEHG